MPVPVDSNDVIAEAAHRAGVSEQHMKVVIDQFWEGVLYYLMRPEITKGGLNLSGIGRFVLSPRAIAKKLHDMMDEASRYTSKIDFYFQLLEQTREFKDARVNKDPINYGALYYKADALKAQGICLDNSYVNRTYELKEKKKAKKRKRPKYARHPRE